MNNLSAGSGSEKPKTADYPEIQNCAASGKIPAKQTPKFRITGKNSVDNSAASIIHASYKAASERNEHFSCRRHCCHRPEIGTAVCSMPTT